MDGPLLSELGSIVSFLAVFQYYPSGLEFLTIHLCTTAEGQDMLLDMPVHRELEKRSVQRT